jgi:hypothetical protein
MKNKFDSEADMLAKLIADLEAAGFEIYKEVAMSGGAIDVVAVKQMPHFKLYWGIEGKMSVSEAVCLQAESRKFYLHGVSIATPNEPNIMAREWLKNRGIGILQMYPNTIEHDKGMYGEASWRYWKLEEERHGRSDKPMGEHTVELLTPRFKKAKKKLYLHELQKTAIAGGCGGQVTQYKMTINDIYNYLAANGPKNMNEILAAIKHHYSSNSSAKAQLRKALMDWESDRFQTFDTRPTTYGIKVDKLIVK